MRGIGRRQVRATLLAAMVVGLPLNIVHVAQDAGAERERMGEIGSGLLALVEGTAARAAYTFDRALAATVSDSLLALPAVIAVRVEDNLGTVLAEAERAAVPSALRWLTDAAFGTRMVYRETLRPPPPPEGARLSAPEAAIGTLTVTLDTRVLANDLLTRSLRLFVLGLVKVGLLAVALWAVANWLVTRPLARLSADVDVIDPDDPAAAARAPRGHGDDELGRLAGAVNGLLARFRRAEAARRLADRRFRAAAASMPDGLLVLDAEGRIAFVNDQFVQNCPLALRGCIAIGRFAKDCIERAAEAGPLLRADGAEAPDAALTRALMAPEGDVEATLHDGRIIRGRFRSMPDGGRVVVTSDVTRRRQMAENLRRAEKLSAVGTLASGVAHDFNNLLAVIFSSTELALARQPADGPARAALERVLEAGRRGRALVGQVMAFSRAERTPGAGVDLGPSVAAAAALCAAGLGDGVRVAVQGPDRPAPVHASETQVHQIVSNLLANAAQAMGGVGEIRVTVSVESDEAALTVADHGPGMDAETRRRACEPFFTTKPVGQGSGLGLAVVYGLAEALGGRVEIDSGPGRGTAVTVRAPLALAAV